MKILIIKFRNIGDVLLSTPLISNLKKNYPDSQIDMALNKGCEEMVTNNPNFENLHIYDRLRIKNLGVASRFIEEIKYTLMIRRLKYDLIINLTEGDRGAQLALFSGAKQKLGFPLRKGLLSKVKVFDGLGDDSIQHHTVEKDLQFLNLLNKKTFDKKVEIYWSGQIEIEMDKILTENNIKQFVHIHPVSRWMFKCWDDKSMAKVIDHFQQEKHLKVVITGAPEDKELKRIDQILAHCETNPLNLSGKLTLKHLACLSSKARLFFGVDTAPMHMAAATNTPVITIFGASEALKWAPWDNVGGKYCNSGFQKNGIHSVFASDKHELYYEGGVKKCRGMMDIGVNEVLGCINESV